VNPSGSSDRRGNRRAGPAGPPVESVGGPMAARPGAQDIACTIIQTLNATKAATETPDSTT